MRRHRLPLPVLLGGSLALAACADDRTGQPSPSPSTPTAPTSGAFTASGDLRFYDAYLAAPDVAPRTAAPGLAITVSDPKRGVSRFAWSRPEPAPPEARLTSPRATTPAAAAALWHVVRHADALGLTADALATLETS